MPSPDLPTQINERLAQAQRAFDLGEPEALARAAEDVALLARRWHVPPPACDQCDRAMTHDEEERFEYLCSDCAPVLEVVAPILSAVE